MSYVRVKRRGRELGEEEAERESTYHSLPRPGVGQGRLAEESRVGYGRMG